MSTKLIKQSLTRYLLENVLLAIIIRHIHEGTMRFSCVDVVGLHIWGRPLDILTATQLVEAEVDSQPVRFARQGVVLKVDVQVIVRQEKFFCTQV